MKKYTDTEGKDWHLDINAASVRDVREQTGINLCTVLDQDANILQKLHEDLVLFVDVLAAIMTDQINERDCSGRDFAKAHGGDTLEKAMVAFREELIDFFTNPRMKEAMRKLFQVADRAVDLVVAEAEAKLETITPELLAKNVINSSSGFQRLQELQTDPSTGSEN